MKQPRLQLRKRLGIVTDGSVHLKRWLRPALASFIGIAIYSVSYAEFECESKVSYTWEHVVEPFSKPHETPIPTPPPVQNKTFFSQVKRTDVDEKITKTKLNSAMMKEEERALAVCRSKHENLSACLTSKHNAILATTHGLSFQARASLEQAVLKDCQKTSGRCLEASSTEPTCQEIVKPAAEDGEAGAKEGDAKEKGAADKGAKAKK